MKLLLEATFACALPNLALSQVSSGTYWFASGPERSSWCGYANEVAFKADVESQKPTESARVVFSSGKIKEVTYQVQPESGDWVVIDKYTSTISGMALKRANLLAQENLQIIQQSTITGSNASSFRTESITTLDGKKAKASKVDYPEVPVRTNPSKFPFMGLVKQLGHTAKVCGK
jgi:hypothetical protein